MHKKWCGNVCSECEGCEVDNSIPCSPDCQNLNEDGKPKDVEKCIADGCDCFEK